MIESATPPIAKQPGHGPPKYDDLPPLNFALAGSAATPPEILSQLDAAFRLGLPAPALAELPRADMMLRWAATTASGKTLRLYDYNRLRVAQRLRALGEKTVSIEPVGCWHEHAGLVSPEPTSLVYR